MATAPGSSSLHFPFLLLQLLQPPGRDRQVCTSPAPRDAPVHPPLKDAQGTATPTLGDRQTEGFSPRGGKLGQSKIFQHSGTQV